MVSLILLSIMKKIFILLGFLVPFNSYSQNTISLKQLELKFMQKQYDSVLIMAGLFMESDTSNWQTYYFSGKTYQSKYKFFDAVEQYKKALDLDSANIIVENELAEAYDFIGRTKTQ